MSEQYPWFKFFTRDFAADCLALPTLAAQGLYVRVLVAQWENGGKLPLDPEQVFQLLHGISEADFEAAWPSVKRLMRQLNGTTQAEPRQRRLFLEQLAIARKRAEAGREGGTQKAAKTRAKVSKSNNGNGVANAREAKGSFLANASNQNQNQNQSQSQISDAESESEQTQTQRAAPSDGPEVCVVDIDDELVDDAIESLKPGYPPRSEPLDWDAARPFIEQLLKSGVALEELIGSELCYAERMQREQKDGSQYVKAPATFFRPDSKGNPGPWRKECGLRPPRTKAERAQDQACAAGLAFLHDQQDQRERDREVARQIFTVEQPKG